MNQRPLADYVTVAERLTVAAPDIEAITTSEPHMLDGPMGYIRAVVKMKDGRTASGTASFRLDLTGGRAQATNPLEDAETSAVGRALAFLGYETKRGVASREEVAEAQRRAEQAQHTPQAQRGSTRGEGGLPRKEPAGVAYGAELTGTVINAASRRVKGGSVLVVEFALAETGAQFVYYDAPADYEQIADGDTITVKAGKPTKDGATYVNAVTNWGAPAGVADDDIPF